MYAVETVLSKFLLRPVLQELKESVAFTNSAVTQLGAAHNSEVALRKKNAEQAEKSKVSKIVENKWVNALKLYQIAYEVLSIDSHGKGKRVSYYKKDINII